MPPTLLLSRRDIRELLELRPLIPVVRDALAAIGGRGSDAGAGQLVWPGGSLHVKSGWLAAAGMATVKANVRPDRGGAAGVLVVLDPSGPGLLAVMDSADITAARTAAMAAVAADLLTPERPLAVAVLGTGPVGRTSLEAVAALRPIASARLWSRTPDGADVASEAVSVPSVVAATAEEAVEGADLVITATPARSPILAPEWLAAGACVLALGADTAGKREVGGPLPPGAAIVVDDPEAAAAVGECAWALPGGAPATTISELLAGTAALPAGRSLTIFDSVGTAVIDVAAASHVLAEARRRGTGTVVHLDR